MDRHGSPHYSMPDNGVTYSRFCSRRPPRNCPQAVKQQRRARIMRVYPEAAKATTEAAWFQEDETILLTHWQGLQSATPLALQHDAAHRKACQEVAMISFEAAGFDNRAAQTSNSRVSLSTVLAKAAENIGHVRLAPSQGCGRGADGDECSMCNIERVLLQNSDRIGRREVQRPS